MAKAAAFPQPRSAPFMKVFEEEGVGFGEGKGNRGGALLQKVVPSPIFITARCAGAGTATCTER